MSKSEWTRPPLDYAPVELRATDEDFRPSNLTQALGAAAITLVICFALYGGAKFLQALL